MSNPKYMLRYLQPVQKNALCSNYESPQIWRSRQLADRTSAAFNILCVSAKAHFARSRLLGFDWMFLVKVPPVTLLEPFISFARLGGHTQRVQIEAAA